MSANIAIGNTIQNSLVGNNAKLAKPAMQSYSQAQATSSVAQVAGAAQSYAAPRTHDAERMRSREVIRSIKQHLKHASSQHISEHAYQEVVAGYQQAMRNLFGEADNEAALHAEAQALLQQWKHVHDMGTRQSLMGQFSAFTSHVSSVAHDLQALQQQADDEMSAMLEDANQTLRHLGAMNAALSSAHMLDQPTDYMEEERDALLGVLAGYLGAETMMDNVGAVRAFIGQDTVLIGNGTAAELRYVANIPAYGAPQKMLGAIQINDHDIVSATRDDAGKFATTSLLQGGALAGIQHARDVLIPETLERFDYTITNLRHGMEAMHHDQMQPSAMPLIVGTRKTSVTEMHEWQGKVDIALHSAAQNMPLPTLTLDLAALDDGAGPGQATMQTLLREINQHFAVPSQKVALGALSNVQLNLLVQQLPTVPSPSMRFDVACSTENTTAHMFLHGVRVLDDAGNQVHAEAPALAHALAATPYSTSEGSNMLQVHATKPLHGTVGAGDMIYLPALKTTKRLNGVDANMFTGCFEVKRVAGNDVFVELPAVATASGKLHLGEAQLHMQVSYQRVAANSKGLRTGALRGAIHCDLRAAPKASHYVVAMDIGCNNAAGGYVRGTMSYRVENHVAGLYNMHVDASSASGGATLKQMDASGAMLEAYLADDAGNSVGDAVGVLALRALRAGDTITVKAAGSKRLGKEENTSSFSQFFGLYPLFANSKPVIKHQPHVGVAAGFALHSALRSSPEKIAMAPREGDISCTAMAGISALHHHLCEQTLRAEDAVLLAENTLEGYQQRVEAVEYIDPAAEMTAIDTYHQSCMVSSRAISQISKLFQTLCADAQEAV